MAVAGGLRDRDDVGHDFLLLEAPEAQAEPAVPDLHLGDADAARRAHVRGRPPVAVRQDDAAGVAVERLAVNAAGARPAAPTRRSRSPPSRRSAHPRPTPAPNGPRCRCRARARNAPAGGLAPSGLSTTIDIKREVVQPW